MGPLAHQHGFLMRIHFSFPSRQLGFQFFDAIRVAEVQVVALAGVIGKIKQEIHGIAIIDVLPVAVADGFHGAIGALHAPAEAALRCWFGAGDER